MSIPSSSELRRDDRRHAAGLQVLLDLDALLAGDRAVVGADELLPGELVEPLGEALAEAPAVREDDRAAVGPDQLEDPRVDRRPDADPRLGVRGRPARLLVERQDLAGLRHVVDRDDDLEVERPSARPASTIVDLAVRPGAAEEPGDRLERALGGAEPDPLRGLDPSRPAIRCSSRSRVSARWAPRFEPAIAWTSSTITCSTPREDLAGLAREHQVQRSPAS